MSFKNIDSKKRLVKSRSGLKIVNLDDECTSPFELTEPFWVPDNEVIYLYSNNITNIIAY